MRTKMHCHNFNRLSESLNSTEINSLTEFFLWQLSLLHLSTSLSFFDVKSKRFLESFEIYVLVRSIFHFRKLHIFSQLFSKTNSQANNDSSSNNSYQLTSLYKYHSFQREEKEETKASEVSRNQLHLKIQGKNRSLDYQPSKNEKRVMN